LALIGLNVRRAIDPCLCGLFRPPADDERLEACRLLALQAGSLFGWYDCRGCLAAAPVVGPPAAIAVVARLDSNTDFHGLRAQINTEKEMIRREAPIIISLHTFWQCDGGFWLPPLPSV
jgi:hypothetical protein